MMDGIDDMPSENEPVYITGVGTEDDGDEAEAQQMLRQNEGIYQTFTQLKADQPFIFMSTVEGRKCYYYVDDNGVFVSVMMVKTIQLRFLNQASTGLPSIWVNKRSVTMK